MPVKITEEYLTAMVASGHLTEEGKQAILQAQTGTPRPHFVRVKVTQEQLDALQEAFPDLVFESLYAARNRKK